jgi:hypothetical protein
VFNIISCMHVRIFLYLNLVGTFEIVHGELKLIKGLSVAVLAEEDISGRECWIRVLHSNR